MKRFLTLFLSIAGPSLFTSNAFADRGLSPDLIGGQVLTSDVQEQFGLLRLDNPEGYCSASMLNDYWAITAAHCVYSTTGAQFTPSQITLTANWTSNTKAVAPLQIVTYGNGSTAANDVALLQTGLYDFSRGDGYVRKLHPQTPQNNNFVTAYGLGRSTLATGSGASATPSVADGKFRSAQFSINNVPSDYSAFSYQPNSAGQITAGGDSGGPSLIQAWDDPNSAFRKLVWRLMGVHSRCQTTCLPGQSCVAPNTWKWVSAISSCTDAAVYPLEDNINQLIQQVPQPQNFIGTFGKTPADNQPIWMYVVAEDGRLIWYRKDTSSSAWQGPSTVGYGWENFLDIIPAGGNSFYAITTDGTLLWYQHTGFNDGSFDWNGAVTVGSGWNTFLKVFSGDDGVVYAIKQDGTLLWYRNYLYESGGVSWSGPKVVGSGWNSFKDVFSMGGGIIYGVRPDGTLVWYNHKGYQDGSVAWSNPLIVGSGWQSFKAIVPAGNGVILAIRPDGALLWYRHDNYLVGQSITSRSRLSASYSAIWEGGVQIGSGWASFRRVFSLLPAAIPDVIR